MKIEVTSKTLGGDLVETLLDKLGEVMGEHVLASGGAVKFCDKKAISFESSQEWVVHFSVEWYPKN